MEDPLWGFFGGGVKIPSLLALALGGSLASGCGDPSEAAVEHFSESMKCPSGSVTFEPRTELNGEEIYLDRMVARTASPEIRGDAVRLKAFRESLRVSHRERAAAYGRSDIFDVSGCGRETRLYCFRRKHKRPSDLWHYCREFEPLE